MYDDLSSDYDRFVTWGARLPAELPFIKKLLNNIGARRVLDAACGTGQHTIALAQHGYTVVGTDASQGMIERARAHAEAADLEIRFRRAGFGSIYPSIGDGFDAVLCLGNSLPHLLTPFELDNALTDFATCLRPGGLLLIQNRNFDKILEERERWMEPKSHQDEKTERLFLRSYDFDPDGMLTFNLIRLLRQELGEWQQQVLSTRLRPMRQVTLIDAVESASFVEVECWGNMQGAPFYVASSGNLLVTAYTPSAAGA